MGTGYQVGSDVGMAFLIPGVETRVENGATLVSRLFFCEVKNIFVVYLGADIVYCRFFQARIYGDKIAGQSQKALRTLQ